MSDSVNDWVRRLHTDQLPAMHRTLKQVREVLNSVSGSHVAISKLIERDPGFSLAIFRQLRTLPNKSREPVTKIANAIPLLGMEAIERTTRELPVLEDLLKGPPRRGLLDCYSRAAHAAIYAANLAERLGHHHPEAFANAALLHDIGEMALWVAEPDTMKNMQARIRQGDGREDAALEVLEFTLEELNLGLGNRWELPELVQESQGLFNSYQPRPLTVMMAAAVARATASGWNSHDASDKLELLAEFIGISEAQASTYLHQLAVTAANQLQSLPLPLPAFRLLQTGVTRKVKPQAPVTKIEQPRGGRPAVEPSPASGKSPQAKPKINPLQALLSRTLHALRDEHGLERAMFAMLSPDRKTLKARFVVDKNNGASLKTFEVGLHSPNLFSILMKKPQALWLNPDNLVKYLPSIPESVVRTVCSSGFFIISVFIKDKPIGVFYADVACTGGSLNTDQFNNFKTTCRRAMQELTH
ncbi:MAG: histidine kinase [endosymbiont of Seepiophila jonesi]|uniref:Histidine kinase n=1 Tax=endosymbiont of Lamellibrachia luymesi TaxID=2200907 RepID=A0A370DXL5_9GAMM|nr:MAG: histidine kinase [endosymbiont of Lamellibrachia luymesi]RDH93351.1 MAG: histidine kinase [endosymbiont of Seepiophila jonesi]